MWRKLLLISTLVVLGIGAGCTTLLDSDQNRPTPTEHESSDRANASIGSPSDLPKNIENHYYQIYNDDNTTRTMNIRVFQNRDLVLNRSINLSPENSYQIELFQVGNYTLKINSQGVPQHIVDAPDTFDCNTHFVEVNVLPNGSITSEIGRTLLPCE